MKIKICFAYPFAILALSASLHAANPIITDVFTADPAPLVVGDTVYLYCGQDDAAKDQDGYRMPRWLCFSSKDLLTWKPERSPLKPTDFQWAVGSAWAAQVVERDGKFYFYATVASWRRKASSAGCEWRFAGELVRSKAYTIGELSQEGALSLREHVPEDYRRCATRSDFWPAYEAAFPARTHRFCGKAEGQTNHAERFFGTLRADGPPGA